MSKFISTQTQVAGLRDAPAYPPYSPKCSQFHAVIRKIWQNRMLAAPLPQGLEPPPTRNRGSAPATISDSLKVNGHCYP